MNQLKIIFYCIIGAFIIYSCEPKSEQNEDSVSHKTKVSSTSEEKKDTLILKTYHNKEGTWGYDVYMNNVKYVHQPNIPALSGKRGFNCEEDAKNVGNLVIEKIKKNIIPPTVAKEELESLAIQ